MSTLLPPTADDIRAAAQRIAGRAVRTPLLLAHHLSEAIGGTILIKPEVLQRTGSFKFRGACNFIASLDPAVRERGVVAYSSGNHAQGVAAAAGLFGIPATIVMPSDAPRIKLDNTRALGATVVEYERSEELRERVALEIATESGATIQPPYDHPWTIAGQGTAGLEIADQAAEHGAALDAVLVCCGGGGLTAGIATAIDAESPRTEVYTVEPAGFDDTARSFASGTRQEAEPGAESICDALLSRMPGELTFSINSRLVAGGLVVTDDEVRDAIRYASERLKLVVEPGGAVALAAVLTGRFEAAGKTVAVVLSGGNIDPGMLAEILGSPRS